jgi:hypothetical protein
VNRFPISFGVRPCTNELVDLSGMAITLLETTPDGNHFFFRSNGIGVTGLGQTTRALRRANDQHRAPGQPHLTIDAFKF